jgi:LPS export ABC transporter protein LptC
MSKRNSIILGLLFVILVIEIVIYAPRNVGMPGEDQPIEQATPAAVGQSAQVMHDVHLVEAKADGKEWELWADRAIGPKTNVEDWTIEKVRVKFFATNDVTYNVTGKKGNVVPSKKDIKIQGNVVTKSSNGYVFKTESVFYDSTSRKLTSPGEVEMTGPPDKEGGSLLLTGSDMIVEHATNEITVNRNVRAKKKLTDGRTAVIQSQRAVFSGRSNMANFYGNVVIDFDTMRLTGPEARFAYDPKTQKLDSLEVGGGARVTDTDKFATANSVNVFFRDDRIVFKGSPRVVQRGDELVGDEIVFLEGGRKVQVSNAKAQLDPKTVEKKN